MDKNEWKRLSKLPKDKRPKDLFKLRKIVEKILGYRCNSGYILHHLRDTEEQRIFNDTYYERWGLSFDGNVRYVVLVTKEEHVKLHKRYRDMENETRVNGKKNGKTN